MFLEGLYSELNLETVASSLMTMSHAVHAGCLGKQSCVSIMASRHQLRNRYLSTVRLN